MTDDIERPRPGRRPSFDKTPLHALFMERLPEFRKTANLIVGDVYGKEGTGVPEAGFKTP